MTNVEPTHNFNEFSLMLAEPKNALPKASCGKAVGHSHITFNAIKSQPLSHFDACKFGGVSDG